MNGLPIGISLGNSFRCSGSSSSFGHGRQRAHQFHWHAKSREGSVDEEAPPSALTRNPAISFSLPTLAQAKTSPSVKELHEVRAGDIKFGKSYSLQHLDATIYRDAALLAGQGNGQCLPACMPNARTELEPLLEVKSKKFRLHPCGERLYPQIKRAKKWQAILDAQTDGDLGSLEKALKSAQLDVELCTMPIVRDAKDLLSRAKKLSLTCEEAIQYSRDVSTQVSKLRRSVALARQLPLGPKLWNDQWLSRALEEIKTYESYSEAGAYAMLADAMITRDADRLEAAIRACRHFGVKEPQLHAATEVLAEARKSMGVPALKSCYFTPLANAGKPDGQLFRRRCFHGEDRHVHVFVFNVDRNDWPSIDQALLWVGVRVYWHYVGQEQKIGSLKKILRDPTRNTVWILSGDGRVRDGQPSPLTESHISELVNFHRKGGGLALWGSGGDWFHEAHLVLQDILQSDHNIVSASSPGKGHMRINAKHPILHNVSRVYESGVAGAALSENLLLEGWNEILRDEHGALIACYLEPREGYGPILLHGAISQLYDKRSDLDERDAHDIYLRQLCGFTVLRPSDVTGTSGGITGYQDLEQVGEEESSSPPGDRENTDQISAAVALLAKSSVDGSFLENHELQKQKLAETIEAIGHASVDGSLVDGLNKYMLREATEATGLASVDLVDVLENQKMTDTKEAIETRAAASTDNIVVEASGQHNMTGTTEATAIARVDDTLVEASGQHNMTEATEAIAVAHADGSLMETLETNQSKEKATALGLASTDSPIDGRLEVVMDKLEMAVGIKEEEEQKTKEKEKEELIIEAIKAIGRASVDGSLVSLMGTLGTYQLNEATEALGLASTDGPHDDSLENVMNKRELAMGTKEEDRMTEAIKAIGRASVDGSLVAALELHKSVVKTLGLASLDGSLEAALEMAELHKSVVKTLGLASLDGSLEAALEKQTSDEKSHSIGLTSLDDGEMTTAEKQQMLNATRSISFASVDGSLVEALAKYKMTEATKAIAFASVDGSLKNDLGRYTATEATQATALANADSSLVANLEKHAQAYEEELKEARDANQELVEATVDYKAELQDAVDAKQDVKEAVVEYEEEMQEARDAEQHVNEAALDYMEQTQEAHDANQDVVDATADYREEAHEAHEARQDLIEAAAEYNNELQEARDAKNDVVEAAAEYKKEAQDACDAKQEVVAAEVEYRLTLEAQKTNEAIATAEVEEAKANLEAAKKREAEEAAEAEEARLTLETQKNKEADQVAEAEEARLKLDAAEKREANECEEAETARLELEAKEKRAAEEAAEAEEARLKLEAMKHREAEETHEAEEAELKLEAAKKKEAEEAAEAEEARLRMESARKKEATEAAEAEEAKLELEALVLASEDGGLATDTEKPKATEADVEKQKSDEAPLIILAAQAEKASNGELIEFVRNLPDADIAKISAVLPEAPSNILARQTETVSPIELLAFFRDLPDEDIAKISAALPVAPVSIVAQQADEASKNELFAFFRNLSDEDIAKISTALTQAGVEKDPALADALAEPRVLQQESISTSDVAEPAAGLPQDTSVEEDKFAGPEQAPPKLPPREEKYQALDEAPPEPPAREGNLRTPKEAAPAAKRTALHSEATADDFDGVMANLFARLSEAKSIAKELHERAAAKREREMQASRQSE